MTNAIKVKQSRANDSARTSLVIFLVKRGAPSTLLPSPQQN
jgi:hypothetical protein